MSKDKPTMRGRGEEIVGRGVDALFSAPLISAAAGVAAAAAMDVEAEEALDALLAEEMRAATEGESPAIAASPAPPVPRPAPPPAPRTVVAPSAIAPAFPAPVPPSPLGAAANPLPAQRASAAPTAAGEAMLAGGGVLITDDELLGRIDVPLAFDAALPVAPPPPPPAPSPMVSPPADSRPSSPFAPSPAPVTPPPVQPAPVIPPPAPSAPVTPAPAPTAADAEPPLPPSRPRAGADIGGRLTSVVITPQEEADARPQSPFTRPAAPLEDLPVRAPTSPEEQRRILAQIHEERIAQLHHQIDQLYSKVPKNISNRPDLSNQIMGLLRQARTTLYEKPHEFVDAEYKVQQAHSLYNRVENSEKWADSYGWRVFWFEVVVFILFLLSFLGLLAYGPEFSAALSRLLGVETPGEGVFTAVGFWATFVWGGIGGVVGAMYILWTHVSERQDFERQHVMWYVAQPIMGLILGGVIFLIINTGLLSLQGGAPAAAQLRNEVQLFPALIAFIAGFRPQFVFGLLIKIIKVINPSEEVK